MAGPEGAEYSLEIEPDYATIIVEYDLIKPKEKIKVGLTTVNSESEKIFVIARAEELKWKHLSEDYVEPSKYISKWWSRSVIKILVPVTAIACLLLIFIPTPTPKFTLLNPIVHPDSNLIIIAANKSANKEYRLDIEYDGFLLSNAGKLIHNSQPKRWSFRVKDYDLPEETLRYGEHTLRIGFPDDHLFPDFSFLSFYPKLRVYFYNKTTKSTLNE